MFLKIISSVRKFFRLDFGRVCVMETNLGKLGKETKNPMKIHARFTCVYGYE
jgi:hypothetical protein